ncbi:MAG: M28 family peptidase, partial [Candidatus Latescibacteria bacterium]|nr:M28 family peptidase [Candidatus Latescibacterota bacterium]
MGKALPVTGLDAFTFERWVLHGKPELLAGKTPVETFPGHGTSGTPPDGLTGIVKAHGKDGIPFVVIDGKTGGEIAYITVSTYGRAVPLPYYSFNRTVGCPPFFNVGRQDVPVIERAAADGVPVTLRDEVEFIPDTPTGSVFGVLPGKTADEILFIAHLDTVYNSPGANDNTASVIAMLMLAHAFSGTTPEKT